MWETYGWTREKCRYGWIRKVFKILINFQSFQLSLTPIRRGVKGN
jgi:hypothetical protein